MGGRAVLTLAQSIRSESVKVARLEFLKQHHGRKLREVIDAEIDISDVVQ